MAGEMLYNADEERAYRWGKTRKFMEEKGIDALVIFGSDRSDRYDAAQYLGFDRRYQHMVFPREGAPTMIAFAVQVAAQNMTAKERGLVSWIEDIRVGRVAELMPEIIVEKKLQRARLGVIGLGWGSPFFPGGWVSKALWDIMQAKLPNADFVDVTRDYGFVMAKKSPQDLACIAKAAAAGDAAIEAMMAVAKPGASETEIYAAGYSAMLQLGMRVTWLLMQTGLENCSWGEPTWLIRPEAPRRLERNDIVGAEIFPNYGELNTHVNMSFTIGDVPEQTQRCGEIARESYEIGLARLRPGASFLDICTAMEAPLQKAGAWHLTPQLASLNPLLAGGTSGFGVRKHVPELAARYPQADGGEGTPFDFEIQPGMTFSLQSDARLGRHWANIGSVVALTEEGPKELNRLSPRLQHA